MTRIYSALRRGHRIEVEADNSLFVVTRLRLILDGFRADDRGAVWGGVRLYGELPDEGGTVRPVTVEVHVGPLGGVGRCVLVEGGAEYPLRDEGRGSIPKPVGRERELLGALRENGGRLTPAGAAMATSLSIGEADEMLSGLAGGGHLSVERAGASPVYALPGGAHPGLEER